MFDSLKTPEEVENLFVVFHDIFGENCGQRCQIVDSIIKHEDFPSFVSRRRLQKFDVQSIQKVWIMILGVALPNCDLKLALESMFVGLRSWIR